MSSSPTSAATPTPSAQLQLPSPSPVPTEIASPSANVAAQISELVVSVPAHVGMVVALPDGTTLYQRNASTLFESASLYKLAIMVEVYRERNAGKLSFDDTATLYPGFFLESDSVYAYPADVYRSVPVETLLTNMITLSSNVAATALLYLVGTDNVNATAASLGMNSTKILWYPTAAAGGAATASRAFPAASPDVRLLNSVPGPAQSGAPHPGSVDDAYNVTTPADIATLFEKLAAGAVIAPQVSAEILDLLAEQQINDRLPAGLPSGTRIAHKTGDLDNSVHDAGVIYAPAGPVVVVVMSDEVQDRQAVVTFMQKVAQVAYDSQSP